jgi:hypothetical protein
MLLSRAADDACDEASRYINARLGGDPRERLCSRAWRLRAWPWWALAVWEIDRAFYRLRGEVGHCARAHAEDRARLAREDAEAMVNAGL